MASPERAKEPIVLTGFKGVDNLHADFDLLKAEDAGYLRNGVNVDILRSGRLQRRRGIAQTLAEAGAHSLFADDNRMVWATDNTLRIAGRKLEASTLLTSELLATPLSYVPLHGEIYFSNEYINGKITAANVYEPWGITPPSIAPSLGSTQTGNRFVQVTCTFVMGRPDAPTLPGEESGAPKGAVVSCGDESSIVVSDIPQSSDARVLWTRIYATTLNGKDFYSQIDVPAGITLVTISGYFGAGQLLRTQLMQPPPLGQLITYARGRIHIANGSNVFSTRPIRYGLYDPEEDFLMYPERVTLLKGVEDGLYVGAERTYFLPGIGTAQVGQNEVLPYRAIEGAICDLPEKNGEVVWLSERGLIRAGNGGAVTNITEGQVAMESLVKPCLGVIERQGHKAVVLVAEEGTVNELVHEDFIAAEAARIAELE